MKAGRCGLFLLVLLFFGDLSALRAQSARAAQPASFERLGELLDRDQVVEGARELTALFRAPAPTSAQAAVLHRAVEIGRRHLAVAQARAEERDAARELICLGRSRLSEELPEPLGEDGKPVPPMEIERETERPELVGRIKAEYTPEAREKHLVGVVTLEIVIDREGCVRKARVLKGKPFGLNESSLAAVKGWSFHPATIQGKPAEIYYRVTMNFQEDDSAKVPAKAGSR